MARRSPCSWSGSAQGVAASCETNKQVRLSLKSVTPTPALHLWHHGCMGGIGVSKRRHCERGQRGLTMCAESVDNMAIGWGTMLLGDTMLRVWCGHRMEGAHSWVWALNGPNWEVFLSP